MNALEQVDSSVSPNILRILPGEEREDRVARVVEQFRTSLFSKLVNLQTVIIQDPSFFFPFVHRVGKVEIPMHFLTHSLKRLHIAAQSYPDRGISASKALWLLTFCPRLFQAILGFTMSTKDHQLLKEHSEAFKGKSNVRELAIEVAFSWVRDDKKTWWGTERQQDYAEGNRKSEAVALFLKVTKNLDSVEIHGSFEGMRPGDPTPVFSASIAGLDLSVKTLKHLRLINLVPDLGFPVSTKYPNFQTLKILSSETMVIESFIHRSHPT